MSAPASALQQTLLFSWKKAFAGGGSPRARRPTATRQPSLRRLNWIGRPSPTTWQADFFQSAIVAAPFTQPRRFPSWRLVRSFNRWRVSCSRRRMATSIHFQQPRTRRTSIGTSVKESSGTCLSATFQHFVKSLPLWFSKTPLITNLRRPSVTLWAFLVDSWPRSICGTRGKKENSRNS